MVGYCIFKHVCLHVFLLACLPVCFLASLFIFVCLNPSLTDYVGPSVCLHMLCLSYVCLCLCLSVDLQMLCLSVCLSVCLISLLNTKSKIYKNAIGITA